MFYLNTYIMYLTEIFKCFNYKEIINQLNAFIQVNDFLFNIYGNKCRN